MKATESAEKQRVREADSDMRHEVFFRSEKFEFTNQEIPLSKRLSSLILLSPYSAAFLSPSLLLP